MKPADAEPVKLFVGLLFTDAELLRKASGLLEKKFGPIDYKSPEFKFTLSDYYQDEMGSPILRKFVSHARLINPGKLAEIKIETNEIENDLATGGKRKVNLDPGYMDYNKVILASAKFNAQKIYLDLGIYADPTLWYENGNFVPYSFSFPDFKTGMYNETFLHMRALFKKQRRKLTYD